MNCQHPSLQVNEHGICRDCDRVAITGSQRAVLLWMSDHNAGAIHTGRHGWTWREDVRACHHLAADLLPELSTGLRYLPADGLSVTIEEG